jgi:nickel transport protein
VRFLLSVPLAHAAAWIFLCPAAAALLFLCPPAAAHQVEHEIVSGEAILITLRYADGTPFSFESYEIFAAGESIPVQVGRSDARGRIAFAPSQPGQWRLRAFSEDGHGVDFPFDAGAVAATHAARSAGMPRTLKILVGLALLFGLFGVVSLFYRSRR